MRLNTMVIENGELATVDLVALGARSELLWRSTDSTLVGAGKMHAIDVSLANADSVRTSLADAGEGAIAFGALPFDRAAAGKMHVPEIVLSERGGVRYLTFPSDRSEADVAAELLELAAAPLAPMPRSIRLELERSATAWRDDVVGAARDHLNDTDTRKAVFARQLLLHADRPFSVGEIVIDLAERFPMAQVFAIDGFVGASPEVLVSRNDRVVRAHPLAGTAARRSDPDDDAQVVQELLASSKDRVEHKITIDWLLTELLPFCSYVDAEPEPSVMSLSNVHHLGTIVEGVLSAPPASVLDLVAAVHPTPAVGGDPQKLALELIEQLEGFDRARYAGPAGWIDADGNGEFAVSVRTAQIDGPAASICSGVGVVALSDPAAELRETQAKFRAMLGTFLRP